MSERDWRELLAAQQARGKFVCVGLDSAEDKLPKSNGPRLVTLYGSGYTLEGQAAFNTRIIDATLDIAGYYKPNLAFYRGARGKEALRDTINYARIVAPDIPIILDAKYGDIGNTNNGYVAEAFDYFGADAVTIHPYMGMEAMKPFLDRADKGVIVLVKTSNPGSAEFQDPAMQAWFAEENPDLLYPCKRDVEDQGLIPHPRIVPTLVYVAKRLAGFWNYNGNVAVVVGATYPHQLADVREAIGDMPILLPGIGAQDGDLEAAVENGRNSLGQGMIINSSRGIIFASQGEDFAERASEEAWKLHDAAHSLAAHGGGTTD